MIFLNRSLVSPRLPLAAMGLAFFTIACGPPDRDDAGAGPGNPAEAGGCVIWEDDDDDGINNGLEGCQNPRDTDGDGQFDHQDTDSDGDGVLDAHEDRNGDGQLGQCTGQCETAADCEDEFTCTRLASGQGVCAHHSCLAGETLPNVTDTDGDGQPDGLEGTWVCNPQSDDNPAGLKEFQLVDSAVVEPDTSPDWRVALDIGSTMQRAAFLDPGPLDSVFYFDLPNSASQVAGFLVTRQARTSERSAPLASGEAIDALGARSDYTTVLRSSGNRRQSLDGFDSVIGTSVVLETGSAQPPTAARARVVAELLGRDIATISQPPLAWSGLASQELVVSFQTLYREEQGQVLFLGAVAPRAAYDDAARPTGFRVDDLAGGTGLARSGNPVTAACEQLLQDKLPKADVIWVVDESGSVDDNRIDIRNNAATFFQQAANSGLDFRMGVTDMNDTTGGVFSTRSSSSTLDDWWLGSFDATAFSAAIDDPSGPAAADGGTEHGLTQARAAVELHTPRSNIDPRKVRTDAQLVVLLVTDELPEELKDAGIANFGTVFTPQKIAEIAAFVAPYVQFFLGHEATVHAIGVPIGTGGSSCGEPGHGYSNLVGETGGQFGSICQSDLSSTINLIIDDIAASASPLKLDFVPIAHTLAVTRDGQTMSRSRSFGFDYRPSSNSLVFHGQSLDPLVPAEIVVSYQRWHEQVQID